MRCFVAASNRQNAGRLQNLRLREFGSQTRFAMHYYGGASQQPSSRQVIRMHRRVVLLSSVPGSATGSFTAGAAISQDGFHRRLSRFQTNLLRTPLVQGAHYILGPFGEDSDLRRWGRKLAERGE